MFLWILPSDVDAKKLHIITFANVVALPNWPGGLFFISYNDLTEKKNSNFFKYLVAKQAIVWNVFSKLASEINLSTHFLQKTRTGYTFGL
jgi:hypothetical protein